MTSDRPTPRDLFDPLTWAREELAPALLGLRQLAEEEEKPDQQDFFARIARGVSNANEVEDLAGPLMELSTSAFRGFQLSAPVTFLLDQVLDKASLLTESLSASGEGVH